MKKIISVAICAISALMVVSSCESHEDPLIMYWATATCKFNDGDIYFEESDKVALRADNLLSNPIPNDLEKRVVMSFLSDSQPVTPGISGYENTYSVSLISLDTVYTKKPVLSLGSEELDAQTYGNDLLGIYLQEGPLFPITTLEDGYLCIRFSFEYMPYSGIIHEFNLVTGANPEDPYEVELRHNAHSETVGEGADGYIAFPLKSLPDTGGEVKTLTLVWHSVITGNKETATFEYKTRTDWPI